MPSEMNPNDPKQVWQNQEVEKMPLTVQELKSRSTRFERRIRWRNFREYAGGVLIFAMVIPQLSRAHGWYRVPGLLMLAGTLYVLFELHRQAGARPVSTAAASLEFHRREMERQRDALKNVWRWYLLPLVPGLATLLVAQAIDSGIDGSLLGFAAGCVAVFAGTWALNQWAARRLDRKIQDLETMELRDE